MPDTVPRPSAVSAATAATAAIFCDLAPLSVLAIEGADAATFLQGQFSSDVVGLAPGQCQYTSYNSPKGRMLANFILWRVGGGYRALLPGDLAEPVRKRLALFVLRAKVTLADLSGETFRFGIGGFGAAAALQSALGVAPGTFTTAEAVGATVLALPGPRYIVVAAAGAVVAIRETLRRETLEAPYEVWQWLTIRAGVPVITAATQDQFVAQTANWDVLGGVNFKKGCYTGQEIIARMHYLGRLKERAYAFHADVPRVAAGARLFSAAFGDQPCGTVVNAAPAPDGGTDLLAVVQLAAVESGDVSLGAADGPPLSALALPYAIPATAKPRGGIV